jgi:NAD(P)-dependent dehydrogenase (short-subunit alcohol dehydrogenase family)
MSASRPSSRRRWWTRGGPAVASAQSVSTEIGGRGGVEEAVRAFGSVEILIDNGGVVRDRSPANLTAEDLEAVLDVHLRRSFHVTQPYSAS